MAYRNFLGEFVIASGDDWPKTIRYVERRPVQLPGGMNPWELERTRRVWTAEQEAWRKIKPLQVEYAALERQMEQDVSTFNSHLAELERVTKKKVGLGPIGTYGGMALAVIPGFGWASAVYSAVSMLFQIIGGNKLKKRVTQLMRIMEDAQNRLQRGQQRLTTIQQELRTLTESTQRAHAENEGIRQRDLEHTRILHQVKQAEERSVATQRQQELLTIRQITPNRVHYPSDL